MMKIALYTLKTVCAGSLLLLASCASFQNYGVADYNGDGVVSDAEYRQYQKQKNVEDRNVYSEAVKVEHVKDTSEAARDTAGALKGLKEILEDF